MFASWTKFRPTRETGQGVTRVKVVRNAHLTALSQVSPWEGLVRTSITIPANQRALILVRFTAESLCGQANEPATCLVRINVGGVQAEPAAAESYVFDTSGDGREGHSIEASWDQEPTV
jgi:hypothetical protein